MKTLIHFHPDGKYSYKFIEPLREIERKQGFSSLLVNCINNNKTDYQIDFSFKISNILMLPFRIIMLFSLIHRNKPQIVFCHNSTTAFFPLLISRLLGVKKIIYFNHGVPFIAYSGILKFILYYFEKINCLLCEEVITVSYSMKKILSEISSKNINILFNGSASGLILKKFNTSLVNTKFLKNQMNFSANDKIILFVGRPNKRKGFYDIIQIWNKYFKSTPNFKLILLGINETDLLKIYNKIPDNIFALSYITNPEKYFVIADYLFVTSYHEGLNYSVLEAMASNTIVVSNNIFGVSELIQNDINGFLVDQNNHKGFFDSFIKCEKNLSLKKTYLEYNLEMCKKYDRKNFLIEYKKYLYKL